MKDSIDDDDDDDDDWDESNELEELDLGFNILPGSLFQLMAIKNIFNIKNILRIKNILIQRGSKLILEQVYHIPYQSPRAYLSCNLDSGLTSTEPSLTS